MAVLADASEESSRAALQEQLHFTSELTTVVPGKPLQAATPIPPRLVLLPSVPHPLSIHPIGCTVYHCDEISGVQPRPI